MVRRFADRYGRARVASSIGLDLTENQRAATDLLLLLEGAADLRPGRQLLLALRRRRQRRPPREHALGARGQRRTRSWPSSIASDATRVRQISAIAYAAASRLARRAGPGSRSAVPSPASTSTRVSRAASLSSPGQPIDVPWRIVAGVLQLASEQAYKARDLRVRED